MSLHMIAQKIIAKHWSNNFFFFSQNNRVHACMTYNGQNTKYSGQKPVIENEHFHMRLLWSLRIQLS